MEAGSLKGGLARTAGDRRTSLAPEVEVGGAMRLQFRLVLLRFAVGMVLLPAGVAISSLTVVGTTLVFLSFNCHRSFAR